jgi:KUP system potassium uptake protein
MSDAAHGHGPESPPSRAQFLALCLTALGVVYGDIGTSPLYAMRECFAPGHGVRPTPENVLGVLSLMFWALMLSVSLKYLAYVMRADNRGEGGILALLALALPPGGTGRTRSALVVLGLFGCALLWGDGMITPAISVLGAVEGLTLASPRFESNVIPIAIVILIGLFTAQRYGTARVGRVFGPIMVLWFLTLATLGVVSLVQRPEVLGAVNPAHAVRFFLAHGTHGFIVLGAVVLCVTGGEALYADMGHFGAKPIRMAWFSFVLPALLLNYFGQAALLLRDPSAAENPFYRLAPRALLYPMIALATVAAIIASQALISGAYSLTRQASMLGYWPRTRIDHTSPDQIGQIYVPSMNWILMFSTIGLVVGFKNSSSLAAAYGVAVTGTMVITSLLAFQVARKRWRWSTLAAVAVTIPLVTIDSSFFAATATKIPHGGWFPIAVGALFLLIMLTWKEGRAVLGDRIRAGIVPLADFYEIMRVERPARVPGTAVFMASNAQGTPPALMHNFLHNHVVHEHVVLLTIVTEEEARIEEHERLTVEELQEGFVRVVARFGFMETPDVPALMRRAKIKGALPDHTTYFLGRETLLPQGKHGLSRWREKLFVVLSRNSESATSFFKIPPDRVLEVGAQIEL